jgi:hypothetical protein
MQAVIVLAVRGIDDELRSVIFSVIVVFGFNTPLNRRSSIGDPARRQSCKAGTCISTTTASLAEPQRVSILRPRVVLM